MIPVKIHPPTYKGVQSQQQQNPSPVIQQESKPQPQIVYRDINRVEQLALPEPAKKKKEG